MQQYSDAPLAAQPYVERLKQLALITLKKRSLLRDLIQVFKYLKELRNVKHFKLFELQTSLITKSKVKKIQSRRCISNTAGASFLTEASDSGTVCLQK